MSFSVWIAFHYLIYDSENSHFTDTKINLNTSLTLMDKNVILQNNDENKAMKELIAYYITTSNIVLLFGLLAICLEYKILLLLFGVFSLILIPFSISLVNSLKIFLPSIMNFINANLSFMLVKRLHSSNGYQQ
jgi:hypothetical protein